MLDGLGQCFLGQGPSSFHSLLIQVVAVSASVDHRPVEGSLGFVPAWIPLTASVRVDSVLHVGVALDTGPSTDHVGLGTVEQLGLVKDDQADGYSEKWG